MRRHKLGILGLSEMRWKEGGDFESEEFRVCYAGGKESQRGVAIILDKEMAKRVLKVDMVSDRIISVKIQADPVDLMIIQVYMPTSAHEDEEVDEIYDRIEELMAKENGKDYVVIMGDWNAVVGEGREGKEIGEYGLGTRNDRGEKLVEFCKRNKFMVTNTWFKKQKRRRYTWIKPGDIGRFQLDYILVRDRYRNSVKDSCSYRGADADSDHNLL